MNAAAADVVDMTYYLDDGKPIISAISVKQKGKDDNCIQYAVD